MKPQEKFRIVVVDPLPGVTYALQRGRSELLPPIRSTATELVFEFALTIADIDADPPRLTGEFAQGPPDKRFVYISSGSMAGQAGSPWSRRAKVPLYGIGKSELSDASQRDGVVLEARIRGTAKDGGPACATVPLLAKWAISDDA
jgi:hypothetical protein